LHAICPQINAASCGLRKEEMKDINELARQIYDDAKEKGWHPDDNNFDAFFERACNNLHDEISELHEAWRNNKLHELCDKAEKMRTSGIQPLNCLEEEMADIIIRCLDNCVTWGVDPLSVIERKMAYNKTREFRHGGKKS
jgi:NTP pyrophosphatase (non-canonical NTP hydrolase)